MKVYVVMGNDYPDCVFANEAAADSYITEKKKADPSFGVKYAAPRIYWRSYEFELRDHA